MSGHHCCRDFELLGWDSVYERTCEPPGGTYGRGAARGGYPESESGDEDEKLAAEMAKVRKMAARLEARMQQKQHDKEKRAGAKSPGRMDDDDGFDQGARDGTGTTERSSRKRQEAQG